MLWAMWWHEDTFLWEQFAARCALGDALEEWLAAPTPGCACPEIFRGPYMCAMCGAL